MTWNRINLLGQICIEQRIPAGELQVAVVELSTVIELSKAAERKENAT